jgi:hypothetical protein
MTVGRVGLAQCVMTECRGTVSRVVIAGCVVVERINAIGRVKPTGRVATKRVEPDCGVFRTDCEAKEGALALRGVSVGIASVWRRSHCQGGL